jgi:hypothetical protein
MVRDTSAICLSACYSSRAAVSYCQCVYCADNTRIRGYRLGTEHAARRGAAEDVRVDPRRAGAVAARHPSSSLDRLMVEEMPAITARP